MKIESMRTRSYRSFRVDDADLPAEARERLSAIRRYDELRSAGSAAPTAGCAAPTLGRRAWSQPLGVSRSAKAGRRAMAERRVSFRAHPAYTTGSRTQARVEAFREAANGCKGCHDDYRAE